MSGGKSKSQTVGYRYFIGLHMILCYGPIDELLEMMIGDRTMYKSVNGGGSDSNITSSGSFKVTGKSDLFGGDDREGGVGAIRGRRSQTVGGGLLNLTTGQVTGTPTGNGGDFDVEFGEDLQVPNTYLDSKIAGNIPAHRGVSGVVFRSFYIGNNPYIKDMKFRVTRYPDIITGETSRRIISDDCNPAQIIAEVLTNKEWGMGYTLSDLDVSSFQAASQTLDSEVFGLSMIWGESQQIEDFISEILKHINGTLFLNRTTGLFELKLVRDDYVVGSLPIFDETNIVELKSFSRKGWGETVNEITLVYTDRSGEPIPVTVQDLANIQIQGGEIINQKVEYPGITREALALTVAARDLQTASSPLARVQFTVNREAWDLSVGDVFRLSWLKYGIVEVVFRIAAIDYGDLQTGSMNIEAIEDVFGLPSAVYAEPQPSGWLDPRDPPSDVASYLAYESNYWDLVQYLGETEADGFITKTPDDGYYFVAARKPTSNHYGFELFDRPNGSTQEYQEASPFAAFAPTAELEFQMELGFDSTFTYINDLDIGALPLGELISMNDEYMQVYSIDTTTRTLKVQRGLLDTIPQVHPAGSIFYGVQSYGVPTIVQYTAGEARQFKMLTTAGLGVLDEDSATPHTFTFVGRAGKPWPPGNLQLEGLPAFQPQGMTSGDMDVTWSHRDKTQQTGAFVYQDDGDIGPEIGVVYNLRLYDELDILRRTVTGIAGNSYSWTTEEADSSLTGRVNNRIRVELESDLSGDISYQVHDYEFRRADYGYSYGYFYGGYA